MITLDAMAAARRATASRTDKPATAIVHDSPDLRLVVFRLAPGQVVAPHRSASTVAIQVLSGRGMISGAEGERRCAVGELVAFEPNEVHGMRAEDDELLLIASIAPRPSRTG